MKKRILACLLALVMLIGLLPVTALAVDAGGTTVPMLDVSKSKTATALDANGQTQITLSLPSAEMKKTLDVVFVVDNAFPAKNHDAANKAAALLDELREMSQEGNLNINVGLVISGGYVPVLNYDQLKHDEFKLKDIKTAWEQLRKDIVDPEWKNTPGRKGSNIQAGIETGLAMLEKENQADKENKYLILISDGGAFSWYDKETGKAWSKVYYQFSKEKAEEEKTFSEDKQSELYYWCNPHDFQQRYKQDSSTEAIGYTLDDFTELMNKTAAEVDKNSIPQPDTSLWNPTKLSKSDKKVKTQYQYGYAWHEVSGVFADPSVECAYNAISMSGNPDYITSREAALYHTAKSIEYASKRVNFIFVSFPYNPTRVGLFGVTESFKDYVAQYENVKLYRVDGENDHYPDSYKEAGKVTDTAKVFKNIKTDLVQLVATGSKVEDTIGSNFELVSIDSLTVDGQPLTRAEKTGDTYTFGDTTKTDRFVVTYDDTTKMLTWNINETITKANTVQLKYTLKLTNPKSAAGTNGVNDLNGDGKEDTTGKVYDPNEALYTNENAYLFPMDSTHNKGEQQKFPKPSVAVGENAIPDYLLPILSLNKATPKLNTRDHFAYVQGYPDGTVKPAGSITRAEVAAILFRLMDADSRSLYYATASGFRDVDSTKWYNTYVATLNNAGVITDSRTGYFRPNDAITRAELAAMLAQFAEKKSAAIYFSDVSAGYWAANAIALTANLGWINGYPDGTFGPDKTVTRAELMAMVNRATGRAPKSTSALLSGMKTWKDNADTARWYYLDVQEATNSHTYTGVPTETWTFLTATPDWSQYE